MRLGFGLDVEGDVTFMLAEGTGHTQLRGQPEQKGQRWGQI